MSNEPATRELSTGDLTTLRSVLEPLRQWLLQAHGQRGLRDGVLGMTSVVIGLVGLLVFGVSPLVALLYLILALAIEGLNARLAMRNSDAADARPFASPLHALAFVEAVIAAFRAPTADVRAPHVAAGCLPHAGVATATAPAGSPGTPRIGRRAGPPPIRGVAFLFSGVMAIFILPLAQAASAIFDRWDWFALAALLAINAAQLWSAWRDARGISRDSMWDRDWESGAPGFGDVMFWKHYRLLPLGASFVVLLLLGVSLGAAQSGSDSRLAFAMTLEGRLQPLLIVLFAISGVLNLMLLAAPWNARRRLAAIDVFDADYAEHRLRRLEERRPGKSSSVA